MDKKENERNRERVEAVQSNADQAMVSFMFVVTHPFFKTQTDMNSQLQNGIRTNHNNLMRKLVTDYDLQNNNFNTNLYLL